MSKRPMREYQRPALQKSGIPLSGKVLIELMQAVHSRGLPFRFSASGCSMTPFIRDGDIISVSPPSSRLPGMGDVVAFLHPETKLLCIHRVLSRNKSALLIQGDNSPGKPDGIIPMEAIMGRVTLVERGGRRIRLGFGPERVLIALLSRSGLLAVVRRYAGPLYGYFKRRRVLCE